MYRFEFTGPFTLRDKNLVMSCKYIIKDIHEAPYNDERVVELITLSDKVLIVQTLEETTCNNAMAVKLPDDIYYITNRFFTEDDAKHFKEFLKKKEETESFLRERASGFLGERDISSALEDEILKLKIDQDKTVLKYGFDKNDDSVDAITIARDTMPNFISSNPGPTIDNRLFSRMSPMFFPSDIVSQEEASEEVKLLSKIKNKLTINLSKVFKAITKGIVVVYYNNTKKYFKDVTLGFDGRNFYLTSPEMLKFFRIDRLPLYDYKVTWFLMEDLEDKNKGPVNKETQQMGN